MTRLALFAAVALVACNDDPKDPDGHEHDPGGGTTEPTDLPTGPGDTDDPTVDDTDTTTPPEPTGDCAPAPGLEVLAFTATAGTISTQVELAVTLSSAASVAVQCTLDADPTEIFFGESTDVGTSHTVRLSGLIPAQDYTCTAAPTCPTMAAPASSLTYQTNTPPADLRPVAVETDPVLGMQGSWTLAPLTQGVFSGDTWLVIWGPDGRARWWWKLPDGVGMWVESRFHPEDGTIVWGGGMHEEGRSHVLDMWDGNTYVWAPPGWNQENFHHDGKRLADGQLMSLEIRENSGGGEDWDGFGIRVHDPVTGLVSFDFDSQVLVDAGVLQRAFGNDNDPWHANWVDRGDTATGGEVYVSLCLSWQIVAIDEATGEGAWLLGRDLGWTVLDENGDPLPEDALPQCQHGLEVTGPRQLLVFDNGQERTVSSGSEWVIDPDAMIAQRIWYWTEPGMQEDYLGDIDLLPNDRVLLTAANNFAGGEIIEVDRATGAVASRLSLDFGGVTYRSERYDGCAFFTSVKECDALATRHAEVAGLLVP